LAVVIALKAAADKLLEADDTEGWDATYKAIVSASKAPPASRAQAFRKAISAATDRLFVAGETEGGLKLMAAAEDLPN
jgi:hypothetical protein